MNLFCFTLDGSTESVYEPAYGQTLRSQCSPALLSSKAEWGGSSPSISSSTARQKKDNRRSCVAAPSSASETLGEKLFSNSWCESNSDEKYLFLQRTNQNRGVCDPLNDPRIREVKEQSSRTQTHQTRQPAQSGESPAVTAESIQSAGRLKRLQNLVQAKRGHQSAAASGKSPSEDRDHNPVLTCIGLGRSRKAAKTPPSLRKQQQQQQQQLHPEPEEDAMWSPDTGNHHAWSPFGCPQPWTPLYHSCHQPGQELWACGGTLSLPRTTEWDRFQSLIQELDSKQSTPQMIRSITDLHLSQSKLTRFGRCDAFRQHSQDKTSVGKQERGGEPDRSRLDASSLSGRKHTEASPGRRRTELSGCDAQADGGGKMEADHERPFSKGRRRSSNSLESLYSLNSGQSSSSGVTSGSDCSSNRNSLRLDDDLSSTRQFCGRARVHTEYVPSPYDTESLKLKVGDVIDIIAKPAMGIWRGSLKGKIGSFKFIYVDVLTDESHEENQGARHRSTLQEVLRRLSLEEYSSSLQRSGYQTVDDLMKLREHHLMRLNVSDPEHRQRLLAAVRSLRLLHPECPPEDRDDWENGDNAKANCPRDSGCLMPPEGSDAAAEEAELHFSSEEHRPTTELQA